MNASVLDEYIAKLEELRTLLEDPVIADIAELAFRDPAQTRKFQPVVPSIVRKIAIEQTGEFTAADIQKALDERDIGPDYGCVYTTLRHMAIRNEIRVVRKGAGRAASVYAPKEATEEAGSVQ